MKLLNLGCGSRFHKDWINIDFTSRNKKVIVHNLLEGIPYKDDTFDVVYHSHLLEHFSKTEAEDFIKECYRVLKPGGIIRSATPNLEQIVENYKKYLHLALRGDKSAEFKYDWTMLEMYDQCVRNFSGGEMGKLYSKGDIPDPNFIYERVGIKLKTKAKSAINTLKKPITPLRLNVKDWILKFVFGQDFKYFQLGRFRMGGEVHQWMYDRFSLTRLLRQSGFKDIKVCQAWESRISEWSSFNLDTNQDGTIYKPDSFYMEAIK